MDGEGGRGFCLPHHVLSKAGVGAGVGRAQPLQLQSVVITDLEPETHTHTHNIVNEIPTDFNETTNTLKSKHHHSQRNTNTNLTHKTPTISMKYQKYCVENKTKRQHCPSRINALNKTPTHTTKCQQTPYILHQTTLHNCTTHHHCKTSTHPTTTKIPTSYKELEYRPPPLKCSNIPNKHQAMLMNT